MKTGDRVKLKFKPSVTGTILQGANRGMWSRETPKFLVKYDGNLIPPQDWHEEGILEIVGRLYCGHTLSLNKGFMFDYNYCHECDKKYYIVDEN